MPIRYSGSPYYYTQVLVSDRDTTLTGIRSAFLASGWSDAGECSAYATLTYSNPPGDGQTFTVAGPTSTHVYVAKNTVTDPTLQFQIVVGDGDTTFANFATLINTRDPWVTALQNTSNGTVRLTSRTSGVVNIGLGTSLSFGASLDAGLTRYGGYVVESGLTPQGLQCRVHITDAASPSGVNSAVMLFIATTDETFIGNGMRIDSAATRYIEFLGCPYQWFTWLLASTNTANTVSMGGVPYIRAAHVAPQIAAVADDGTGQVQITTGTAHGRVTGDHVYISGVKGIALNSWWPVTVVDATNYVLQGSTYAAGWNVGTGRSAGPQQISRCLWSQGSTNSFGNDPGSWRNNLGGSGAFQTMVLNQFAYLGGAFYMMTTVPRQNTGTQLLNFGDYADILEVRIGWPIASGSGTVRLVGELWNCFLMTKGFDPDTLKNGFDTHNWIQFGNNDAFFSLWLVKT